ncbi:MAG: hypothetical protein HYZ00_06375 [Candidatus Hydrogenedentes bacterium]|nr:hypothetical protein [Candidatus Hydrogenedentota bacterium]
MPDEPKLAPRPNWLLACGSGCAVLVIAGIVSGVLAYRLGTKAMEASRNQLRDEVQQEYDALKEKNAVPAEHRDFYDAAVAESQRGTVGTWGLLLYLGGIIIPLKDGQLTADEWRAAQAARGLLQQDPAPSPRAFANFVSQHPVLQADIDKLKVQREEQGQAEQGL